MEENVRFRIQPKPDLKYYEDLVTLHSKVGKGADVKTNRASNVVLVVVGVVLILDAFVMFFLEKGVSVTSVFGLLIGALALTLFARRRTISAKRIMRNAEKLQANMDILVDENGIRVGGNAAETVYQYAAVEAIYFWRGSYVLYVDKVHIVPVPVSAFVEGEPDDFAAYLTEKTGLQVQILPDKQNKER